MLAANAALDDPARRPACPALCSAHRHQESTMSTNGSAFTFATAAAAATLFAAAAGASAQPTEEAAMGRDLARHWCAGCHQVEAGDPLNEVAPSFSSIANDPSRTPDYLWAWLSTAHPMMPDFNLTYREIRSVIAFLESLRKEPQ
jgi:mono/diheme cytochrome c family protein